jgi:sulfite exporter TauE/SafE
MHNLFLIGLLNGLLPCGLVYVAVAGALNTHDVVNGILFMLVFGLGTIPVMMGITLAGHAIGGRLRARLSAIVKPMVIVLGICLYSVACRWGFLISVPKQRKLTPVKEVKVEGSCCTPAK